MRLNSSTELLPAVLPILDMHDGAVDFRVDGRWVRRWHPEVRSIDALLRRAVGRPRWDSSRNVLVMPTAALGQREGLPVEVPLSRSCGPADPLANPPTKIRDLEPA